jgi:hypothetical protein
MDAPLMQRAGDGGGDLRASKKLLRLGFAIEVTKKRDFLSICA